MPLWLGKIFSSRTAVQAAQENPVLLASIAKSSLVYQQIPLREFIDEEARGELSRQLYLDINEICNSTDPVTVCREKLAATMLEFALFQVLVIPPPPENDSSRLRGHPGISGELKEFIVPLTQRNDDLCEKLRDVKEPLSAAGVWEFVQRNYWTAYWTLESINAVRLELGDSVANEDWYKPFMHAVCASREQGYRMDLALPSGFASDIAESAPTAYSIFTDIVLSGAGNPVREWREYYQDSNVPCPGEEPAR